MPTSALATISKRPASPTDRLVRERLARLAELIRRDGAPYPLTAPLVNVWVDVFARANVTAALAETAFDKAEERLKFWPSPAEVLGFISFERLLAKRAEEEAAQKFEQVLAYAIRRSPDIPDRNPPRIRERTQRAINTAGGLDYLRDCDRDSLQWARKRFIDAYIRYGELQQDEYLPPAREIRDLLEASAEQNRLTGSDARENDPCDRRELSGTPGRIECGGSPACGAATR
jgi:hypothetical protein